ncbi:hypothetical protein FisN_4Hh566 [Fistulifera solaris]|uniref:Uncharacterized protein n=1 Tax=Fistulifera solaris TaxID=1519565 RepID=A0A1Z5K5F3_FISSO|nr:hypothetical protein FisN_4Hh566 [Fistulifera solaris]|eukprot:GAX21503.1 hypothetical protein FisN_4Hh566 [Fistulifera solaris]
MLCLESAMMTSRLPAKIMIRSPGFLRSSSASVGLTSCQPAARKTPNRLRLHSTCTMDLVSNAVSPNVVFSTLQHAIRRDVLQPYSGNNVPSTIFQQHLMESALLDHLEPRVIADEMDLVQAAERREQYDKIILLLHHGENLGQVLAGPEQNQMNYNLWCEEDPESLTGKGIGQALTLSRRMAAFCNEDTRLLPELIVVAPLRKVLQTTFMAFPYDTPAHTIRNVKWVCHPDIIEKSSVSLRDIKSAFGDIDCSLFSDDRSEDVCANREESLLQRADSFLNWLNSREERVVVVSGDTASINTLSCRLQSIQGTIPRAFHNGELRTYGVHFSYM